MKINLEPIDIIGFCLSHMPGSINSGILYEEFEMILLLKLIKK